MYGYFLPQTNKENDKYGFVNEYEIRISTALSLVLGVYSFVSILFFGMFDLPMIFIGILWIDFFLKVFFGPQYSIFGSIVRPFIKKTYWVGAVQKRFAWGIGLFLSTFAFFCILIVSGFLSHHFGVTTEIYQMVQTIPKPAGLAVPISPPLIACVLCIIFMTLESVFGYCVGCRIYAFLVRRGILKQIPGQNCANGVCKM